MTRLFLAAPKPKCEPERIDTLRSLAILDTPSEEHYDELTELALTLFKVPIAQISLIDEDRQFIKSSAGLPRADTARDVSFCAHTILENDPLIVLDTFKDKRFRTNPYVLGDSGVRFYAGVTLWTRNKMPIGTFCLIDREPHASFSESEVRSLKSLASLATELIEKRLLSKRVTQAEQGMKEAHERFLSATHATTDGIWELDYATSHFYSSPRLKDILGNPPFLEKSNLHGLREHIHNSDITRLMALWRKIQELKEVYFEAEMRCLHEDGSWRWLMVRAVCRRDVYGNLLKVIGAASDITSQKVKDPLTGLHNRDSLIDQLQRRIDSADQEPRNFALYYIDLDSFKRINDSVGHANGDSLLIQVASRLEATVLQTPGSMVARLGGDEFALLVSDLATEEDALTFAALLEHLMIAPFQCDGQLTHLSASIGVVFGARENGVKAEGMLEEADIAMSRAKTAGKVRAVLFRRAMKAAAVERMDTERELRQAIEQQQIELYYQPKVDLRSGRLCGLEALLRWCHPVRGVLPAGQFIPLAEETGLIHLIGSWVANESISQISDWILRGVVEPDVTMAINLSAKQLRQNGLWESLTTLCHAAGLPLQNFTVEITESVFIEDPEGASDLLNEGSCKGFGLDLDDFGTGYSSLSYLHQFPFKNVKIDRSFVGRMTTNKKSSSLVASIIGLAHSLNMGVIAEGVETMEQSALLRKLDCKTGQGYLFGKPMTASNFEHHWCEPVKKVS